MSDYKVKARLAQKIDTEANWAATDLILLPGEIAVSSDNMNNFKVGDGVHRWSELSYYIDNYRVTGTAAEINAMIEEGLLPEGIILNITNDLEVVDDNGAKEWIDMLFDGAPVIEETGDIKKWIEVNCDWHLLNGKDGSIDVG